MPNLNRVTLIGHLTRDPEMRYTASGAAVCNFTLALNRKWTNRETGEKREEVCFIDCTAWTKVGEIVSQYVKKGEPLLVEGHLRQDKWVDKETGGNRQKIGVTVENVQLLGGRRDGAQGESRDEVKQPAEDDVPF